MSQIINFIGEVFSWIASTLSACVAGGLFAAALIFFGIMFKDRYDNGRWNSFGETFDKLLLRNNKGQADNAVDRPAQMPLPKEDCINRISTSCCCCHGAFTVELKGYPESFDVNCPYCYRLIHYTRNK